MPPVTSQSKLFELLDTHPEIRPVLSKHGVPSPELTCVDRVDQTLEEVAPRCGFELGALIDDLNRTITEQLSSN